MKFEKEKFEGLFGKEVPSGIVKLFEKHNRGKNTAVIYKFSKKCFVVEVQCFLCLKDLKDCDIQEQLFAFAVTTDGGELLIDLKEPSFPILQREYGDIDQIDVSLSELLDSQVSEIPGKQ